MTYLLLIVKLTDLHFDVCSQNSDIVFRYLGLYKYLCILRFEAAAYNSIHAVPRTHFFKIVIAISCRERDINIVSLDIIT